jgi:predicted Ser/Thr protein kinase
MSPERWAVISRITADALEIPDAERDAWLADACGGDDALRREVESLLAADADAAHFLATPTQPRVHSADLEPAAAPAGTPLEANRRVGSYRVVRELGHGGMGVVYLAARDDDAFDKLVAVKVMRGWLSSETLERRFSDERRILARLEHPHIARLLDGGTTADGLPYLVMEYVEGVPIDEYCAHQALPLRDRLRLFQRVCAAVQYAHQRLVIHRDIKPSNILVTPDGTPKLLDFGIARLVDGDGTASGTLTALRAFTPDYASPEQVRGEPMTLASDVYGLGVLLFELVTGVRPFRASSDVSLLRAICDGSPARPAEAARTGTGLPVGAELEWVILEALRKEPARRYQSVQALSDDVGRLLKGLPVSAAPDSLAYRTSKFVGRNWLAVAAGVLLAVSLTAGVVATWWQTRRADAARALAEERLQSTRRLANAMVFEVNDALEAGSTSARALLLQRASEQPTPWRPARPTIRSSATRSRPRITAWAICWAEQPRHTSATGPRG